MDGSLPVRLRETPGGPIPGGLFRTSGKAAPQEDRAGAGWCRIDCRDCPVAVTSQKSQPFRLPVPALPLRPFTALMTSRAAGLGLSPVAFGAGPEMMSIRPLLR